MFGSGRRLGTSETAHGFSGKSLRRRVLITEIVPVLKTTRALGYIRRHVHKNNSCLRNFRE